MTEHTKLPDIVELLQKAAGVRSDTDAWLMVRGADEIERLRSRLEMDSAWQLIDGKMQRISVEPGSIPDGIECRDETIKLQKAEIARLRLRSPAPAEDGEEMESAARAIYDLEPFFMPAGQMVDGVEMARKFSFDDAPAYRQTRAREFARAAIGAHGRKAEDGALPCDVMVAPATIVRKGCALSTLMLAISRREGQPTELTTWTKHPRRPFVAEDGDGLREALVGLIAHAKIAYEMYPRNGDHWKKAMKLAAAISVADAALSSGRDGRKT